jgi:hypothetical protein
MMTAGNGTRWGRVENKCNGRDLVFVGEKSVGAGRTITVRQRTMVAMGHLGRAEQRT